MGQELFSPCYIFPFWIQSCLHGQEMERRKDRLSRKILLEKLSKIGSPMGGSYSTKMFLGEKVCFLFRYNVSKYVI